MKIALSKNVRRAFARRDMIAVVVILGVLAVIAFFVLSALNAAREMARSINCASNLKQVGLAFRVWEGDNGDNFPMQVYTNKAGGPLFIDSTNAFRYYQVMSNELNDPKVLVCPSDRKRTPASNFNLDFNSDHLAYFTGIDATEKNKDSFLAGDSNLTNGTPIVNGLISITTNQPFGWTRKRHGLAGNIVMSDGHADELFNPEYNNNLMILEAIQKTGFATNRLLLP